MSILISDIADYMEDLALGTVATDIFIASQPSSPDDCVTVYESTGLPADDYVPLIQNPTFQIIVRSASFATGRAKAANVFAALHQKANVALGDNHVYYILATSDVGYIGRDENERHEWSMNFRVSVRDDS